MELCPRDIPSPEPAATHHSAPAPSLRATMSPPTGSTPPPVMLGFAGRMVGGGERLDHYTTKVGGAPDWPPARAAAADATGADSSSAPRERDAAEPPEEMTACDACGTQMALVVQAHAPLTSGELPDGALAPDRTLYLMTCFHPACPRAGANAGRWKCLRAQRRDDAAVVAAAAAAAANATTTAAVATAAPSTAPADAREGAAVGAVGDDWGGSASASADDWGASAADDWGADAGVDAEMDHLSSALDALATDPTPARERPEKNRRGGGDADEHGPGPEHGLGPGPDAAPRRRARGPTLPEFYLVADWEPDASSASALTPTERADAERLLARYAAAEGIASEGDDAAAAAAAVAAAAAASSSGGVGGDAEWSGEGYEAGTAEGLDRRYLKFSKRLRRAPEQCVRYAFGGAACWPADGAGPESRAPRCARCRAPRTCELQLMPPLLHFAAQAHEWSGGGGGRGAVSAEALDAWDWQTVAAFTCSRSCGGPGADGETEWTIEAVDAVDGDGGIAELLASEAAAMGE